MAFVEKHVRTYDDGRQLVTWRARYRDPSGREHSRSFDRKVDAERYLTGVERRVDRSRTREDGPA